MQGVEQFPRLINTLAVPAAQSAERTHQRESPSTDRYVGGIVLARFIELTARTKSLAIKNLLVPRFVIPPNTDRQPDQPRTTSIIFVNKDDANIELPIFQHSIPGTMVTVSTLRILPQFPNPDDLGMTRAEYEKLLSYRQPAGDVVDKVQSKFPPPIETVQISLVNLGREKDPNYEATASYPGTATNRARYRDPFEDWRPAARILAGIELQPSADNLISARRFWQERNSTHFTGIYWGARARREELHDLAEATKQIIANTARREGSKIAISRSY